MPSNAFTMRANAIKYPGMSGWHFLAIPKRVSAAIKKRFGAHARGWGSLRVSATVGKTSWKTSIFPDAKSGTYLLPLKAAVRKKEDIGASDNVRLTITLLP